MTSVAVLSAVAFVLAFFEFPVPLTPSFARMDLSDFPALVGAFAFGPMAGILIELVKKPVGIVLDCHKWNWRARKFPDGGILCGDCRNNIQAA